MKNATGPALIPWVMASAYPVAMDITSEGASKGWS